MKNLYLIIDLASISIPLLFSFSLRTRYFKRWKYLFPSMLITAAFFLAWDVWFTEKGVWGFNPEYLIGVDIINLPLEEWLFFICIPFSSIYIYDTLKYYGPDRILHKSQFYISGILGLALLTTGIIFINYYYTATTFIFLAMWLFALTYLKKDFLGRFFLSYLIILIPFFIVNGILTGSWINDQVVWYNDNENLGFRLGTIPFEDTFYGMLMILMSITFYEWMQSRAKKV